MQGKNTHDHAITVLVLLVMSCVSKAQVPDETSSRFIRPPDVFVHVALVRAELELIRFEMGKPENRQPKIAVQGAAPREVFFQGLTLFRKADRLCFEQTRQRTTEPLTPAGQIRPPQVYAVVDTVLERIRLVKKQLGIKEQTEKIALDPTKTSTDVFRSIVQANRQLNLLLDRKFSPSDVFQQITSSVGYTSRLLARFPGAMRIPQTPTFVRRKRPADVYRRLVGCFMLIRKTADQSGIEMLTLDEVRPTDVTPSDVYDIASLVVSELNFLHGQFKDIPPPRPVYYPGRKFPSHVYQRAGILERQLIDLQKLVGSDPDWLSNKTRHEQKEDED